MDTKEAKDILSDMRDRHSCFLGDLEMFVEWQKEYLKEAWACDSAAKALEKQIPMKPNNIKSILIFPADIIRQKAIAQFVTARDFINQIFIAISVDRN